jgi:hypothetical protein
MLTDIYSNFRLIRMYYSNPEKLPRMNGESWLNLEKISLVDEENLKLSINNVSKSLFRNLIFGDNLRIAIR